MGQREHGTTGCAVLAALCLLAAGCRDTTGVTDVCGDVKSTRSGIVNGDPEHDPAVVDLTHGQIMSVGVLDFDVWCTGTLVDWNVVLTAAHCIEEGASLPHFRVGADASAYPGTRFRVLDYHVHPDYGGGYGWVNDMAVLIIEDGAREAGLVPLAVNLGRRSILGETVQAVGYGMTAMPAGYNTLRWWTTQEVVVDHTAYFETSDGGLSGMCFGDSGGPLLYTIPGVGIRIMGVTSRISDGETCLGNTYYVRTDTLATWLEDHLPSGPCGFETWEGRCEEGVAVWCEEREIVRQDCTESGLECTLDPTGLHRCTPPCLDETYEGRCDEEGWAVWCEDESIERWNCEALGLNCGPDLEGRIRCVDDCTFLGLVGTCNGSEARWCEDGTIVLENCSSSGLECAEGPDGLFRCLDECTILGLEGECLDGVARWCESGRIRERDCVLCEQECGWAGDRLGYYCL
jgi:hypothetical protein